MATWALFILLAAGGTALALQPAWKDIEAAARKEGAVVLYHNFHPASAEQIIAAFNAAYPEITVSESGCRAGRSIRASRPSTPAGRADACGAAGTSGWMSGRSRLDGEWQPLKRQLPRTPASATWGIQAIREMIVSTRPLSCGRSRDWPDLFDPKWKGRIGMNPPWRSMGRRRRWRSWKRSSACRIWPSA
jgi:iron(III) transport system substrate-binding protein